MDISYHRLNQLIQAGKITLQWDAAQSLVYYTRKIFDPETDEQTGTKNIYLPPLAQMQDTLQKTNDERAGLIVVRDFVLANQ